MSTSRIRGLLIVSLLAGCGDDIAGETAPTTSTSSSSTSTSTPPDPTTGTTSPPVPTTTAPDETSGSSTGPAVSASSTSSSTDDPDPSTSTTDTPDTTTSSTGETTTDDTTTSAPETTGDFLGCQEPTDSDTAADPAAWSRHIFADLGSLDAGHMEVDHTGAVILSDIFYGDLDLGDVQLVVPEDDEESHHYLVKYDATGAHDWSLDFGGMYTGFDEYDLALDCAGNLFLAGSFYGPMTIDGVTVEATPGFDQQGDIIYPTTDILVAKFTPGGQLVWARSFGDDNYQRAHDLVTTDAGGIVLAGALRGTLEIDGAVIVADDSYDGLLLELDDEGEYRGHRSFGAPADVVMQAIDRSAGGQLTVLGNAADGVDFGGGPLPAPDQNYLYIAQFEQTGDHRWSLRGPDQFVFGVASDDDAAVYLIGNKSKTAILTRYDPTGAITWTRTGASTHSAIPYDIDVTGTSIAIVGTFRYSIDFGGGTDFTSNTGNNDLFLARYTTDGTLVSAEQVVSGDDARPRRVRVGPDGEAVFAGRFEGSLELPTGVLMSTGARDIFLHRTTP